ncbi:transglycosylase [Pseudoalteromonas luteoviolacea CPMOR-1]|uniref:Transglycosylase n=1 Tax=Pseudoalteromonas luteoviolacea CPMOR-1 TaxID=1365248 RepID=A0A167GZN6_9GAMM|nr:phage tail tape measure protein [Pseudoalteromonas luteoviolacea]KZN57475.1 transglycosylase [Pseudoalteromonas luteoviolacea CPMOR-1]
MAIGKSLAVSVVIGAALAGSFKTVIGQSMNQFNRLGETVKQVESTSASVTGFQAVSQQLKKTRNDIEHARTQLQQYQSALKTSQSTTLSYSEAADKATKAVISSKRSYESAHAKLKELKQEYAAASTKSASMKTAINAATQEVKKAKATYSASETALKKANNALSQSQAEHQKLKQKVGAAHKELNKLDTRLGDTQRALSKHRQALTSAGLSTSQLTQKQIRLGETVKSLKRQYAELNTAMQRHESVMQRRDHYRNQMLDAAALGTAMLAPVAAAVKFESVMADVGKVVNFDSPAGFAQMGQDILHLSTVIPMAADGIGDIVASAGQAGIARHELLTFAQDAAKMGVAFDLSGKEAGSAMTGLRSQLKLGQSDVVKIGDAFNHLSNNMDAQARDMLNITNRTAGMGQMFGLTGQQIGALSATFLELKTPPEVAATGINAMLLKLRTADKQGKKFGNALSEIGLNATDLKSAIEDDAQGALISFLESVKTSDDVVGTLSDLFGAEYSDDMAKLISGLGNYKKALRLVSDESQYLGSMQDEFATRSDTTANSLTLLKNRVTRLGVTIGSVLLPPINFAADIFGKAVDSVAAVANTFPVATKVIVGLAVGLATLKVASVATGYAWSFMIGGCIQAGIAVKTLSSMVTLGRLNLTKFNSTAVTTAATTNALGASPGIAAFGSKITALRAGLTTFSAVTIPTVITSINAMGIALMTTPIGWAISAIALGALMIYKYWQPIKAFMVGVKDGFIAAIEPIKVSLAPLGQMFGWVGDKIGSVVGWVSQLFTPVNIASEELKSFTSAGQAIGAVFGSLVNFVTAPFQAASWFIEKSIESIGWLGDTISEIGGMIGFGDEERPVTELIKPVTVASALAVTPAMAAVQQPNQPSALVQPIQQQYKATKTPIVPDVDGTGRYELNTLPKTTAPSLTQPVVQQLHDVQPTTPQPLTQPITQHYQPVTAPKAPDTVGMARYELNALPEATAPTLTQSVIQQLHAVQSTTPQPLTQPITQHYQPVTAPKVPDTVGTAHYELNALPEASAPTLTQPVIQQLHTVQSTTPQPLTQPITQHYQHVTASKVPDVVGAARYELDTLPTTKALPQTFTKEQFQFNELISQYSNSETTPTQEHNEYHTWHVTINQQPNENSKELIDRIMREIDKRKAQRERGKLYDS